MADRKPSPPPGDDPLATRVLGGGVRAGRALAGATGVDRALDTAAEEAIVQALDSPAVERAVLRLADEGRLEEVLVAAAAHVDVEGLVSKAIDSDAADRVWEQILASDKAQMLVERVAEAPEVRAAIAQQGFGLISDIGHQVSRLTEGLDDLLERLAHKLLPGQGDPEAEAEEAGFVTRLVAFAIDIALFVGALLLGGAVLSAIVPFAFGDGDGLPSWAIVTLLAAGFVLGAALFANFWYLVGQTPGMRFLGIRLVAEGGGEVPYKMAVRRAYSLPVAIAAAGLGVLAILVNPKRQGWHDRFAHTVVIYDESSAPWSGMEGGRPQLEGRKRRHLRDRKLEGGAEADQPAG